MNTFKEKLSEFFANTKETFAEWREKRKEKKLLKKQEKENNPKVKKNKKERKGKRKHPILHGIWISFVVIFFICFYSVAIAGGAVCGWIAHMASEADLSIVDNIKGTYDLHKAIQRQLDEDSGEMAGAVSLNLTSFIYAYDENGNEVQLEALYDEENREWADLDMENPENSEIPMNLVYAFIAIEDERFFSHQGFDIKRTFGAAMSYIELAFKKTNDRTYGGSTITQQLIKNYTSDDDYSIERKVQEIYLAYELEQVLTKNQILELYLNTIYLSQQCNGVRSAAKVYFNKEPNELTLEECASIAAITQRPTYYDPRVNAENNKQRRNVILAKMLELGYITQAEYDYASSTEVVLNIVEENLPVNSVTSYYTDAVIDQVLNDLMEEKGCTEAIAKQLLYSGGLRVYSAVDSRIQKIVDDYYADNSHFQDPGGVMVQSSMVIIDPNTGYVAAIMGGRGEKTASRTLNRATQTLRQPGSSIKPIAIYGPAVEYGLVTPSTIVTDAPITINGWSPRNDDRSFRGNITVSAALAGSRNVPAVRILQAVGIERSFSFLTKNYHISSLVDFRRTESGKTFTDKGYAAIGLGGVTDGISVLEMAAAYVPFASKGYYYEPSFYTKVTDSRGNIILERNPTPQPAISESTAVTMTQMLRGVVTSGTGTSARLSNMPAAGKTGTTSDKHDRWFVGYTPYYVGAVWYGYDDPKPLNVSGNPSAKIWQGVMTLVHEGLEYRDFNTLGSTSHYLVCADSGLLPNSTCNNLTFGDYTKNLAPKSRCTVHEEVDYGTNQLKVEIPEEPEEGASDVTITPDGGTSVAPPVSDVPPVAPPVVDTPAPPVVDVPVAPPVVDPYALPPGV